MPLRRSASESVTVASNCAKSEENDSRLFERTVHSLNIKLNKLWACNSLIYQLLYLLAGSHAGYVGGEAREHASS